MIDAAFDSGVANNVTEVGTFTDFLPSFLFLFTLSLFTSALVAILNSTGSSVPLEFEPVFT